MHRTLPVTAALAALTAALGACTAPGTAPGVAAVTAPGTAPAGRSAPPTGALVTAGRVVPATAGAQVCLDLNRNARCDPGEPATTTDAEGRFDLPASAQHPVLATWAGADGRPAWVLRAAPADRAVVSPLSTQGAVLADAGVPRADALRQLAARIGVAPSALEQAWASPVALHGAMEVAAAVDRGADLGTDRGTDRRAHRVADTPRDAHAQPQPEADPVSADLIALHQRNVLALLQAALAAGHGPAQAMALATPQPGGRTVYAWTQFSADDAPFSTSRITAVSSGGVPGDLTAQAPMSGAQGPRPNHTPADLAARYQLTDPGIATGHLVARAIVDRGGCPDLVVDGHALAMAVRAPAVRGIDSNGASQTGDREHPIPADFEVLTCERDVPPGARTASVDGQRLRLADPAAPLQRVVVVGDTGCRVQGPNAVGAAKQPGAPLQDCADEAAWPWARIARAAASFAPDLVIHNGDIHYREGTPRGTEPGALRPNEAVYGPYADTITYGWKAWQADFFAPAGPLLAAAPWAITRGNHELCDRAGAGWYRFLDYRRFPAAEPRYSPRYDPDNCSNHTDPLTVRLGDLQLILMDIASLADGPGRGRNQGWTNGDHVRTARQLTAAARLPSTREAAVSWLVTHKPLLAYYAGGRLPSSSTWQFQKAINPGEESFAAGNAEWPANLQMVHSGHIHGWQMISHPEATGLPTQFLVGMSGQALEGLINGPESAHPHQPLAPHNEGHDIPPGDGRWPWHQAGWSFQLRSGQPAVPDAFSTSPTVDAGTVNARNEEFGFVVFDRIPGTSNWTSRMYDPARRLLRTCTTVGKRTRCDG